MSLETVTEDIREEARARASEILEEADERAESIVADAEADAEEIEAEAEREVERQITQEREQTLSSAKLEAKQARLEARRAVLARVREEAEAAVADIGGDTREELTREMLDAAATEFEDVDSVQVYGRSADRALVESILADYEGFEFAGEYDCLGGVVVESDASRVRVNNTFDSVLEEVWEENLREVSDRLFEQ